MIITRAVKVYYRVSDGRLSISNSEGNLLNYIPIKLWLSFKGKVDHSSGLIVNVSHIKTMVRSHLAANEVYCKSIYDILVWASNSFKQYFDNCLLEQIVMDFDDHQFSINTGSIDMLIITRKYELAAAHRLWNDQWSQDKNYLEFGKCANPNGHGHNYTLEVSVKCSASHTDNAGYDVERIDQIINDNVIEKLDHKNLCLDIPEMLGMVPTVENMSVVVWDMLDGKFENGELTNIRIWETQNTYADYAGQ